MVRVGWYVLAEVDSLMVGDAGGLVLLMDVDVGGCWWLVVILLVLVAAWLWALGLLF